LKSPTAALNLVLNFLYATLQSKIAPMKEALTDLSCALHDSEAALVSYTLLSRGVDLVTWM